MNTILTIWLITGLLAFSITLYKLTTHFEDMSFEKSKYDFWFEVFVAAILGILGPIGLLITTLFIWNKAFD